MLPRGAVSKAETCWFSRRQPHLISVCIHVYLCKEFVQVKLEAATGPTEETLVPVQVGDMTGQDSRLVRKLDLTRSA